MSKIIRFPKIALLVAALATLSFNPPVLAANSANPERLTVLLALAKQENPKALYHLGMMYLTGSSVDKDQRRAVGYFRDASRLGDALASYKLGCFYDGQYQLLPIDLDLAMQHKLVAAEAGYALAQQDVAALHARRDEYEKALVWLEKAAAQGTPGALAMYASFYNVAPGIERNPVKTAAYFRLFLKRVGGSDAQQAWLEKFEAQLTLEQRLAAEAVVQSFRPNPTPLTQEALSGMAAADRLIAEGSRKN